MMKLSVLLGGAAAAEFRGFGAGFPDLFANDGFGSMPSMFNEQEKHTDNHQHSAFGSMLDGGDMMDGGMFSDMDRESKQMEDSMNSNFRSIDSGMRSTLGAGLSQTVTDHDMEVKGQLAKGLALCSPTVDTNCLIVDVSAGNPGQVVIKDGDGSQQHEEHKSATGYSYSSSSSSGGSSNSFSIPFPVDANSKRSVAYNPKDGTFSFRISKE